MKRLFMLTQLAFGTLALAEAPAAAPEPAVSPFIPLIIIFAIFYFLIMRPQQRKARQHQKFLAELKRGEMVITNAGIIGTVKNISDKFVTLEVDRNVCLKMLKSQILESANTLKEKDPKKAAGSLAPQSQE